MDEVQIQSLWKEFTELLLSTNRAGMEDFIKWLDTTDFKYAPASTQYHSSFRGGLLKHSLNVFYAMYDFGNWLQFMEVPQDTIIITALLHDICKIDSYIESKRNVKDETGQWISVPYFQYDEVLPWGHGEKSVILIMQHGVQLNNIEISMIRNHMGFTSNDDERRVSKLFRICPQSVILHCADLEATMMLESYDGPQRFIEKLKSGGRNLTECLANNAKPKTIKIDGTEYELAKDDEVVDDINVIVVNYNGQQVKVYAPYGDRITILRR